MRRFSHSFGLFLSLSPCIDIYLVPLMHDIICLIIRVPPFPQYPGRCLSCPLERQIECTVQSRSAKSGGSVSGLSSCSSAGVEVLPSVGKVFFFLFHIGTQIVGHPGLELLSPRTGYRHIPLFFRGHTAGHDTTT